MYKSIFEDAAPEDKKPEEIEVTPTDEVDAVEPAVDEVELEKEAAPMAPAVDISKLTPQQLAQFQKDELAAKEKLAKSQMQNSFKRYQSVLEGLTIHTKSFFREEETIDANEIKGVEADNKDMFCPNCGASNSNPYRIGTLEGGSTDKLRICANCGTVAKEEEFKKEANRTGQADLNAAK